jgi:hypothetical protein
VGGPLPFAKSAVAVVYRGLDPATPNDPPASGSATAAGQVTAPSAAASRDGGRLLLVGGAAQHLTAGGRVGDQAALEVRPAGVENIAPLVTALPSSRYVTRPARGPRPGVR